MYIFRNYNHFLIHRDGGYYWDDFYIHRFRTDFKKLVKFNTLPEAQEFLAKHPELEERFNAWILLSYESSWD